MDKPTVDLEPLRTKDRQAVVGTLSYSTNFDGNYCYNLQVACDSRRLGIGIDFLIRAPKCVCGQSIQRPILVRVACRQFVQAGLEDSS